MLTEPPFEFDIGDTKRLGHGRFRRSEWADSDSDRLRRAELIARFLTAGARIFLDALVEENGRFRVEEAEFQGFNREGTSPFESIRHQFCNMTGVWG